MSKPLKNRLTMRAGAVCLANLDQNHTRRQGIDDHRFATTVRYRDRVGAAPRPPRDTYKWCPVCRRSHHQPRWINRLPSHTDLFRQWMDLRWSRLSERLSRM